MDSDTFFVGSVLSILTLEGTVTVRSVVVLEWSQNIVPARRQILAQKYNRLLIIVSFIVNNRIGNHILI